MKVFTFIFAAVICAEVCSGVNGTETNTITEVTNKETTTDEEITTDASNNKEASSSTLASTNTETSTSSDTASTSTNSEAPASSTTEPLPSPTEALSSSNTEASLTTVTGETLPSSIKSSSTSENSDSTASTTVETSVTPLPTTESNQMTESSSTSTEPPTTSTTEPTTTVTTTTSLPTLLLSDFSPSITWTPTMETLTAIEAKPGYKIDVVVEDCNLDTENGEYVSISSNEEMDSDHTVWFVYKVTGKPSYLFNTNKIYVYFKGTRASNFTANFTQIGEEFTTVSTEEPTTSIYLPTPSTNESDKLTVNLGGKRADEYKDESVQLLLKEIILEMAVEYCDDQHFFLAENLTTKNVILHQIVQCPNTWTDYKFCVSLTFAVPIELDETKDSLWSGYQLNSEHLRIMWEKYYSKYLTDDLEIYHPPDADRYLKWQIIMFSGITLLFVICLVVVRFCTVKISEKLRRRNSDTHSIISSEDRKSEISLPPHYLQETPALFDSEYAMYNPDADLPYMTNSMEFPDYQEVRNDSQNIESDTDSELEA